MFSGDLQAFRAVQFQGSYVLERRLTISDDGEDGDGRRESEEVVRLPSRRNRLVLTIIQTEGSLGQRSCYLFVPLIVRSRLG